MNHAEGLDPDLERRLEEGRPRRRRPLSRAERLGHAPVALAFAAAATAAAVWLPNQRSLSAGVAVTLVALFAVSSRVEFYVGAGYTVPTQLVFVPMLLLLPTGLVPALVALGFLLGKLPDYVSGKTHPERAQHALADSWFAIGPAIVLAFGGATTPGWTHWPLYVAALAAQFVGDFVASSVSARISDGSSVIDHLGELSWVWAVDALLAPIGLLAALAGATTPYAFLLVVPLIALLTLFSLERHMRIESALALSHAYRGAAGMLGDLVADDDAYTGAHSQDVTGLAAQIAERMGLDRRQRRDLEIAALLHDVGKISIPNSIIHKTGALTQEEMALVRTHTTEGHRILSRFGGLLGEVGSVVRSCHERWDGAGYPDGLAGDQIPLAARIIFACDSFNAMTTDRPYRNALSVLDALAELRANAGTQFDPAVIDHLISLTEPRQLAAPPDPQHPRRLAAGVL